MNSRFFVITSCLISLVGASTINPVFATKLNAKPLPTERELKDFDNSQAHTPEISRYSRRLDYRDAERLKAEQEEAARKQAEDRAVQAHKEKVQASAKAVQQAIDDNNRGVMYGKQGRWVEAIQAHEAACQKDPSNKQFRINLSAARCAFAQERFNRKEYDAASGLLRKALAAAPDNGMALKLLNDTMRKQGRDPSSAEERMSVGDQLCAIGDWESAMVEYQTALQLESTARTSTKMGDLAFHYGQISTAINWYRKAITQDKDFGAAQRQLGIALLNTNDPKLLTDAASALRTAVILDSKDALAGQQLVELWRHQVAGNPLLAENHLGLAGALQLTGDFAGAESEYNKLQALEPTNAGLAAGRASLGRARQHAMAEKHKLAAETLFNQGLKREALAEISQAAMMEPKNAKYQFLLGECLEANGDLRGAHQAYLTCVLIDPEKNKEAAYRMKEMQRGGQRPQMGGMPMHQSAGNYASPSFNHAPVQAPMQHQMATAPMMQKNMFEGGSGMPSASQMGFRTHDESSSMAAAPQAVSQPVAAQMPMSPFAALGQTGRLPQNQSAHAAAPQPVAASSNLNISADAMSRVVEFENSKNYDAAVAVLREQLNSNLQNAEVHHRVAVDLLAGGNITEAIAEFRIASALRPSNKEFAGDLARAMAIHKRSMDNAFGEGGAASGKEVAAK